MFFINLFLAFFIGYVVGQFLPENTVYRDGLLAISGFSSFPILTLIEKKFAPYIVKFIIK